MAKLKTYYDEGFKIAKTQREVNALRKSVEAGEYRCHHNPTVSSRNPHYNPARKTAMCRKKARHLVTITRRFVMMTTEIDLPLCDDHKDWHF